MNNKEEYPSLYDLIKLAEHSNPETWEQERWTKEGRSPEKTTKMETKNPKKAKIFKALKQFAVLFPIILIATAALYISAEWVLGDPYLPNLWKLTLVTAFWITASIVFSCNIFMFEEEKEY